MTLKVGMQHWVHGYYQVCSNDDTGLTLTCFQIWQGQIWSLNAFVWEIGKTTDFSETVLVCDIKVIRCSQL